MDPTASSNQDALSLTKVGDPNDPLTQSGFHKETSPAGASPSIASHHRVFAAGDLVDHFRLIRKLGEGGFGQVWLADDTTLHRQVAIKLPHRTFRAGSTEAKRFYREAETAAQLTHPNLIPILDAVLQDEQAYIVSEYCPGPTLMRWMHDRQELPSPEAAVSIVAQLASGVNVAHQLGLIHRDIKPSNILMMNADTDHPTPRLTDFGLARAISDVSETRTGALVGSGPYMSPEQASGNIDEHGPHSDVHALGVLLYELLTRQSPFASKNEMDTLRRIISLDPPSIRDVRPTVSRDISAVCQRCLEKSPTRRYQDAGELLADLQRLLDGRPPIARPVGRVGRLARWASRNVAIASLSALAMVSCLFAVLELAAYAVQSQRHAKASEAQASELRVALGVAEEQRADAITQRAEAIKQSDAARRHYMQWQRTSYTSDLSFAFLRFHQSYLGDVRRLLDRQIPEPGEADLRTLEWWVLDQQVRQSYELWGYHEQGGNDCRLINQDTTLLTTGENGGVIFWDTETAKPRRRLNGFDGHLTSIAVLPSGELVIPGAEWPLLGRSVHVVSSTDGKVKDVLHCHPTTIDAIEVSDDGNVIASASRYESIRCWLTKQKRSVDIPNLLRNESFAMTADGKRIVTGQRHQKLLQVFDTHTGEVLEQTDVGDIVIKTVGAHRHPWVAYRAFDRAGLGLVHAEDLGDRVWIDSRSEARVMRFSRNDRFVAVGDRRGDVELLGLAFDPASQPSGRSSRLPNVRSIARSAGLGGNVSDVEVSREGDIYCVSEDGALERFSPLRKNVLEDTQYLPPARHTQVTADGQIAWSVEHGGKLTWSTIGDRPTQPKSLTPSEVLKPFSNVGATCISRDQGRIAVLNRDHWLHVYETHRIAGKVHPKSDTKRSIEVRRIQKDAGSHRVKLSSTGRYVAATVDDNDVVVYDLQSTRLEPICYRSYENDQHCFEFSTDEETFICAGFGGVEVVDLATDLTSFLKRRLTTVSSIAFDPNGQRILVGTTDGAIHCLDARTGQTIYQLHGLGPDGQHTPRVADLAFYSDDRLASLTDSGELQFWDLDQRTQLGSLTVHPEETSGPHCRKVQWLSEVQEMIVLLESPTETKLFRWSIPEQVAE